MIFLYRFCFIHFNYNQLHVHICFVILLFVILTGFENILKYHGLRVAPCFASSLHWRHGNVVILVNGDGSISTALVLSVWKGSRKKKLTVVPCIPENCYGFRAVDLTPTKDWFWNIDEYCFVTERARVLN